MARTVNVNFRMDSDLKKNMEQVCSQLPRPEGRGLKKPLVD